MANVAHVVVNESLVVVSIAVLPVVTSATGIEDHRLWPDSWPFWLQLISSLLVFDLGITFVHYASHRLPLLWRFHAVHHSVRRLIGVNGILKHPIHQTIEMAAGILPLIVMGLPQEVAKALGFLTAIQLLLQHSNVDYTLGPLRRIIAGAEMHRSHHHKDPRLGNVNFGLFTSLGDRLLSTIDSKTDTRLDSLDLGVAGEPDYPVDYLAQLVRPFT